MASASSEPVAPDAAARERVAALEAELQRSERRREAAEQRADLLEARDERLEAVIAEYERQLKVAKADPDPDPDPDPDGPLARLTGWVRAALE